MSFAYIFPCCEYFVPVLCGIYIDVKKCNKRTRVPVVSRLPTVSVSQVIANMRVLMTEDSNSAVSNSFLLDDDSRYVLTF